AFTESGYTKEELKMLNETRKILHDPQIKVSATCVRVPVFYGHSEAISLQLKGELSPEEARQLLKKAKGVVVVDDPQEGAYPLAVEVAGRDEVFVGRIRRDIVFEPGLSLWVVADNIRKGAATNAVQIAELLLQHARV
ncbi:MAG: Asd/ArgC dimerization domain-containing protein, partial [Aquificaceae bacterium]|nr:Asd/ArgC dimerization domain-containing protein [Aquificaceae bacterium]